MTETLSRFLLLFKADILSISHSPVIGPLLASEVSNQHFPPNFQFFSEQRGSDCRECEPVCAGDDDCCSWHSICDSLLYANTDCRAPHSGRGDDERNWNYYG